MANSILPKTITFSQWVKHPGTAAMIFAFSIAAGLLVVNQRVQEARVKDSQEERNLWKAAYDTMLKLRINAEQQLFLERYYKEEFKRTVDSLVQDKLQYKINPDAQNH